MAGWIAKREGQPKPWLARYRMPGGRTISKAFELRREANAWLAEQRVAHQDGGEIDRAPPAGTFGAHAAGWLADRGDLRQSTRDKYESYLGSQLGPLADRPVASITTEDVRGVIRNLKRDYAPDTVRTAVNLLGSVLEDAGVNVMPPREERRRLLPRVGPQRHPDSRFLTRDEFDRLAAVMPDEYRAAVYLGAFAGLRWGEVAALSPRDVSGGVLRVGYTLVQPRKGAPYRSLPKTDAARRTVALGALAGLLAAHIDAYATAEWVFPSAEGGPLRASNWRRRVWVPATIAAGLAPPPLRFHDLRHTHAAWLIAQGEPVLVIQRRLGHASPAVTLGIYGDLMPGVDEVAAERLTADL